MNEVTITFNKSTLKGWLKLSVKATLIALAVWLVFLVLGLSFSSVFLVALLFLADLVMKFMVALTVVLAIGLAVLLFSGAPKTLPKE